MGISSQVWRVVTMTNAGGHGSVYRPGEFVRDMTSRSWCIAICVACSVAYAVIDADLVERG